MVGGTAVRSARREPAAVRCSPAVAKDSASGPFRHASPATVSAFRLTRTFEDGEMSTCSFSLFPLAVKPEMPDYQLRDKVVVVTGASRGIGEAAARFFAECGSRVVLAARTESDLVRVVEDIEAAGGTATAVRTDVADAAEVDHLVEETLRIYGRLDAAFNNARSEERR